MIIWLYLISRYDYTLLFISENLSQRYQQTIWWKDVYLTSIVVHMWNVGDIVCWGCVMLEMWDGRDVRCLGCGMLGMWDVGDVGCSGCGMFGMWGVRDVGWWGCGMFWIWNVGYGMFTGMWNVDLQNAEVVLVSSLLILNYFTPSPSFSFFDFEQVNICWESYLIFYSFDFCSNVSMRGRQDLARSNIGNSIVFLISNLEWDVTLAANLPLLKWFIQGIPKSLYKCDHQILGTQK